MKLPIFIKIILNILFYILYVLIVSILFGLFLGFLLSYFDKPGIIDWTTISYILQTVVAIVVLFLTIISRKYFYISFDSKIEETIESEVKEVKKISEESNDELDISILKEK